MPMIVNDKETTVKGIKPKSRRVMGGGGPEHDGDDQEASTWPPWLRPLLQASFFVQCKLHADAHKSECNMFCLDCMNCAVCPICVSISHGDHRAIQVSVPLFFSVSEVPIVVCQIRRSSYHDVIRVSEIQKYLDIAGVQTYIINSARIVFLNERPQTKPGKGVTNTCVVCDRSLLDSFSFCSIGCKIAGTSKNFRKSNLRSHTESSDAEEKGRMFTPPTPPPTAASYRSGKRRKGIPQRSPMGGFHIKF